MVIYCPNCEYCNELDFVKHDPEELACENCNAPLYDDLYQVCPECNTSFDKSLSNCPNCLLELTPKPFVYGAITYVENQAQYREAINFLSDINTISCDTEGNSLDPYTNDLFLIQLGNSTQVYVFNSNCFDKLKSESFWTDKHKLFIFHNAKYDLKVLKHSLGITVSNIYDTYIAERLLTCGLSRKLSLKDVTQKYLNIELDKEIRNEFIIMTKQSFFEKVTLELINYSAKDVFVLEIIQQEQYRQLTNASMLQVAAIEFKLVPLLVDIELTGIKIDTKKWEEIIAEASLNKEKILTEINKIVTVKENNLFSESSININSPKVLKQIFSNFGIEISDTSERTLKAIDHPIAQKLLEYRTYEKQLTSFGKEFLKHINIVTGRIHPAFQQIGADTGRFSCTKPNLQQIPAKFKKYRECFITEQDYSILACDYSQQELRILASLSGDPKFIQFYKDGVDLHAATASLMFDIPIDKVEKDTHRRIAKNINFGLVYGQGAKRLAETIGKTTEEAEALINKYFSQFTYIKEWLSKASQEAIINGYSKTMYGRKRYYNLPTESSPDRNELLSRIGRRGKNTPIQGTASDMMKIALIGIHEYLQSKSLLARIINVVHDEVVLEVKNDIAQTVAEEVKNIMVHAGESLINNVPITAEYGIHEFWQH